MVAALADVDSQVGPYLNRLSDLLWTMARWQEGEHVLLACDGSSRTSTSSASKKSSATKKSSAAKKNKES